MRNISYLYKQTKQLTEQEVQTFVVTAKKPQARSRKKWGYNKAICKGVYHSQERFLATIPLISINELSDKPHNAFIKCFATHRPIREKAFDMLGQKGSPLITGAVKLYLIGLWQWFEKGEEMDIELTPQDIMELGQRFGQSYLSTLPPEERLAGLTPTEVMSRFKLEERLLGTTATEVMSRFKLEERLAGTSPTDVITYLKPKPGEILAGLSPCEIEELENHLKTLKKQGEK